MEFLTSGKWALPSPFSWKRGMASLRKVHRAPTHRVLHTHGHTETQTQTQTQTHTYCGPLLPQKEPNLWLTGLTTGKVRSGDWRMNHGWPGVKEREREREGKTERE